MARYRTPVWARGLAAAVLVGPAAAPAAAVTLPAGFTDALVASVASPTALAFTPDGRMLIANQGGRLRVYENGRLLDAPALTLGVCTGSERGLLGVAVDPQFASNSYVYLFYTRPGSAGDCSGHSDAGAVNRVSRFTLPAGNVIDPAGEAVLIDNMPSWNGNHNGGDLQFGKDGYLYVSVGDSGCDYAGGGCGGSNDASRDQHVLLGKILRITRDGGIPPSNPFQGAGTARCNVAGRTAEGDKCQETFAWGLRNPFRMAFDPNAAETRFFINDVGQNAWEEIDLGQAGADYGYNCREGAHDLNTGGRCNPRPPGMVDPIFEYNHGTEGCSSITGGAFVPAGAWPAQFEGAYLFADYVCGKVFRLARTVGGGYAAALFAGELGSSSAVAMAFGPHAGGQALYYTTYADNGQVRRIGYAGPVNRPPLAVIAASPTLGPVPLVVNFDGSASRDPDPGQTLTYVWDFGDGDPPLETAAAATFHVYARVGTFTATLRVRDSLGASSDPDGVTISTGNSPPVPVIGAPAAGAQFRVGEALTLSGGADDPQDGALPASALSWTVLLHHGGHTHPYLGPVAGNDIPLTAPAPEDLPAAETSFLEIRLTATDSEGLSRTVVRRLMPRKVELSFATVPEGLRLEVGGTTLVTPARVVSWEGHVVGVAAAGQVDAGGHGRVFAAWSDGGAAAHAITTPASPATYTARFAAASAVAIDDVAVEEGRGGAVATFTVSLSDPSAEPVTVDYATADGSAGAADYAGQTGSLTFDPGTTTRTLGVPIAADAEPESAETYFVTLANVAGALLGKARGQGWILDAGAGPRLQFSQSSYAVAEGGRVAVAVERRGDASSPATVSYLVSDGTAGGEDYAAASGTLRFEPGVTTRSFTVSTSQDARAEGDETLLLALADAGGGVLGSPATAVLSIRDDDSAGTVQFAAPSFVAHEAGPLAVITVTRSGGAAGGATVDYATGDGTASEGLDYLGASGTLSFAAGVLKQTFTLPLLDDGLVEENETVVLTLTDARGGARLGGAASALLTIQESNPVVQFGAAGYGVAETAAGATITVRRFGPTTGAVTVSYATSDGTARAGFDYRPVSGVLSFGPGVASRSFTVPILDDAFAEAARTVLLRLSGASPGAALGQLDTAVLTIGDDDAAGTLRFSATAYRVAESAGTAVVRVVRSGGTADGVAVDYATGDGSALAGLDYREARGTLSFGPGVTARSFSVTLLPRGEPVGDRSLGLALSNPAGGAALGMPVSAALTIASDDPLLQFGAREYKVGEGARAAVITVRRSGPMGGAVTVDYATADGTAVAGEDYTPASGTLAFGPGVASRSFAVPVTDEALVEGDETVALRLSRPRGGAALGVQDTALLTIATDNPRIQFAGARYSVAESTARAVIAVRRTPPLAGSVRVDYETADGTATAGEDYTSVADTLSFGPGVATRSLVVPLNPDALDEDAETVGLRLLNPGDGAILGMPDTALLTIGDDDVAGRLQFSAADFSVAETGPLATVTVTRTGGGAGGVTVDYAASDGSGAVGRNYAAAAGTLVFAEGEMARTFTVEVLDDGVADGNRWVRLKLSNPTGGASLGPRAGARLWIVGSR